MSKLLILLALTSIVLSACQPVATPNTGGRVKDTLISNIRSADTGTPQPAAPSLAPTEVATLTPLPSQTTTPTLSPTPTPTPVGLIQVDSLEQEVYPFVENGNCSLAEAIYAANLQKRVDACPAGGLVESTIELIPGTYRLTQIDATPQQVDWAYSTTGTGNALPAVVRTLTIHGNGAVLSRQDASEPYRILEVLYGNFTLENITLEGGEVNPDDDGGALLSQNASITLDGVTVRNNKAEYGGGVYFTYGGLTVRNSIFVGNEAFNYGGGLYGDSTRAELTGNQFSQNIADDNGGGLYIQQTFANITDNVFIANRAQSRGGAIGLEKANATVLRNQFYNNFAEIAGGAFTGRNYIYEEDIIKYEVDPMIVQEQDPTYQSLATQIPGFRATLVAHPSGLFVLRKLLIEAHDNCFVGNLNPVESDLDIPSAAIAGKVVAQNNYYGDPSGPSGIGSGQGQSIGQRVDYLPFLSEAPAHCDLLLAEK